MLLAELLCTFDDIICCTFPQALTWRAENSCPKPVVPLGWMIILHNHVKRILRKAIRITDSKGSRGRRHSNIQSSDISLLGLEIRGRAHLTCDDSSIEAVKFHGSSFSQPYFIQNRPRIGSRGIFFFISRGRQLPHCNLTD